MVTQARRVLFALLCLLSGTAGAGGVIEMDLKAGIGGYAVAGRAAEIRIRLLVNSPVDGELQIHDANGITMRAVQLDEMREQTLWLPVVPGKLESVRVRLVTDRAGSVEKEIAFSHSRIPLTVISSRIPAGQTLDRHQQIAGIAPVILAASGLPHTPQAYNAIDALIADPETLSALSEKQYAALSHHLERCGAVLLPVEGRRLLQRLRDLSGCNGRFIQTYETLSQVTSRLLELGAERPPGSPAPSELMALRNTGLQQQTTRSLGVYLGGYILFIALANWRMKKTQYLLLLPFLVAGAGALAWSGEGSHRQITWAETESGDSRTRLTSLLLLGGNRQGEHRVIISPSIHLSGLNADSVRHRLRYAQDNASRTLYGHTRLLSPLVCHLVSVGKLKPDFRLRLDHGRPRVVYRGDAPAGGIRLLWRGKAYAVPTLTKGAVWQPDEIAGVHPANPAERLLNRRLEFGAPALLMPYKPASGDTGNAHIHTTGWLVIRHEAVRS